MAESHQTVKKHAACDECRTRKLKCSGHQPKCSRCERENIICIYSPQKQMGRPRKRRRDPEEIAKQQQAQHASVSHMAPYQTHGSEAMYLSPGMPLADFGMGVSMASHSPSPPFDFASVSRSYSTASIHDTLDHHMSSFPLDPQLGGFMPPPQSLPATASATPASASLLTPPNSEDALTNISCACLSSMYLTLSNLQSMTNFSFPFALQPVRHALATADAVLECPQCPKDANAAMLNVTISTSLLFTIAHRVRLILEEVNAEAARAARAGATKLFALGDANGSNAHLHTQTSDCPARFELELSAHEWEMLAKKVVRKEVYGSNEGASAGGAGGLTAEDAWRSLAGIIARLEQRQMAWHRDPEQDRMRAELWGETHFLDIRREHDLQEHGGGRKEWHCIKQAASIRMIVENLPW